MTDYYDHKKARIEHGSGVYCPKCKWAKSEPMIPHARGCPRATMEDACKWLYDAERTEKLLRKKAAYWLGQVRLMQLKLANLKSAMRKNTARGSH